MKKLLLLMLTILTLGFAAAPVSAQQIVDILGDAGTTTNSYLPIYTFYNNTLSEQIYTADEIGMPGTITSIAFYNGGDTKSPNIKIYMINTNKTEFTSTTDWFTVTTSDLVYDGTNVALTAGEWTTITLDVPFFYDGVSNLGLIVDGNLSWSGGLACRVFSSTSNCAMYVYSDGTDYDAVGASYSASNQVSVKNQIKLGIIPGNITCHPVGTIVVSGITASNAILTWGTPEDGGTFLVQCKTSTQSWDDAGVISEITTDTTYDFSSMLTANTYYNVRVANMCSGSDTSIWRTANFLTSNVAVQLPYTQDFETNPESITDFMISNNGPNGWYIGSATGMQGTESTVHSLYISNNNGTSNTYTNSSIANSYAVLDVEFDNTPMEWHLSFDYNVNGEGSSTKYDYLSVYVMDGGAAIPTSDAPNGTAVLYQSNLLSDWTHFDAILEGVVGTSKRIVFYWRNDGSAGSNPPAAVDNIQITGFTCAKPSNVQLTSSTSSSLSVSWTENGTASSWSVFYREHGATGDYTEVTASGIAEADLIGLNPDTPYDIYVVAHCDDGDDSQESNTVNFRTQCYPITQLPYFTNFDSVISDNGTNFVSCWSRYTTNPSRVVRCYGSATHSGSYALDFNYSPACTTAAVTPMLDASIPLNTVMVDFWAYSSLGQGWMEVGTMSDPADFSTYEFYDTVRLSAASTWENLIIDFSNYSGSNQYIAFLEINGTSTSYIFDDFTITYSTNCLHPTNLAADSITNSTVTLSWTEAGSATAWEIEYGPAGFTPGTGTTVSANTNPFTVDNLTPAVTYDFYVSANCGGEVSTPFGPVQATPGQYIMSASGSDTLTTCAMVIYDNGGPTGNYTNSCDFTLVLYPENPNAMMALTGTSNTEGNNWDYIRIYDSVGTSGTELAYHTGQNQTVNVISQSGPLTLVFHSDGTNVYSGIALTASCVTCYPPTNITASNPTLDGATLTWQGTGDSYVLFLNGDMTTGYDAAGTSYTFSNLTPSSSYSVQIASICDGDTSMLSTAATFSTGCGAITITADNPWVEDFESYSGSGVQQFICWERPVTEVVDNGTAPFVYCNYGQSAHSGANTAEMKGTVNMLALPEFTNNLSELRISFWATGYSYSNTNVEVGYMTDVTDSSTFVPVFANAGTPGPRGGSGGGNGNYMGPFSFSNVSVSNARIALRYTGPGSGSGWNVDDFTVELTPACESPVKTSVTASNIGGHVATITWVDNDPSHTAWTVYYKETAGNDWSTFPATDTTVQLTGLDPQTAYDVYVITDCGTPETNPDATHTIHFTTTVACPAPTGLTLASVTTDEATITWNGTASSYNVEYGPAGFTPGTGTQDVALTGSFTMQNLTPSTGYTIYVNSDCSDNNDSLSTTVSFTFNTTQVPAPLPYTADFTQANEWVLNNGTCPNYWTTGTVSNVPSLFVTNNGTTPGYNTSSVSIVSAEKLLTVGDNSSFVISFDVNVGGESSWDYLKVFFAPAESSYPAATSVPTFATYSYSTYAVDFTNYLPQTGYASYPYKLNLTQGNTVHVTVEMPNPNENATSSSTAKLVFVWRNDGSSGTQPGPTISNVNVMVNSCPMPSNFAATNVTSNTADLSWTAGDQETEWEVEYGATGFAHGTGTVESVYTTPSTTLTNLTPGTSYDVYLRAVCGAGDSSAWVGPVMVSPGTYTLPTTGTYSITSCDLIIYDNGGANGNYSNYCDAYLTIYPENTMSLVSIQGTISTEGNNYDYLYVYDGVDASGTQLGYFNGQNLTIPELISSTGPLTIRFYSDGSNVYSGFAITVSCVSNTCPAPTNFTASNIGMNTADLSWTAGGSESAWVVEYKESSAANWTVVPVTTTSYQLTGLTALTDYNVRVKADCGDGDESIYKYVSFTTPNCDAANACQYMFILTDSYGDGWNGGYLTVTQDGNTVATLEAVDHSASGAGSVDTVVLSMCDNSSTSLVWNPGNYEDEAGFSIVGPDGTVLFTHDSMSTYTTYTFTTDCSGSGPVITNPTVATTAATAIAQTTATLNGTITNPDNVTITAKGFEWKATVGGTYAPVTVTGDNLTYNLTGLTANTGYTYKAFITYNGTTVYGNEMTFTTLDQGVEPCNVPTGLTVGTVTHESIAISWDNDANVSSWNIQYRPVGGTLSSATSTTNSYTITGLTPETEYQIQVQADCGDGNVSDWSAAITATTTTGIENHLLNSISLYPNPAKEVINVQCTMNNVQVTALEVFDVYGKLINTVSVIDNPTRINVSGLAAGMYFVRVTTEEGVVTKSFVKK